MNIKLIKILKLLCVTFVIIISQLGYSFADDDDNMIAYNTDSFITNIKVNKDYTFDVTEVISVDFKTPKHGIFRVIPTTYGRYKVKDIRVEGGRLNISSKEKTSKVILKILRIGDKDKYLTGKKKYTIKYKIVGINVGNESNILRLNLIPTNWNTPIKYARTTVIMPTDYDFKESDIFYGGYGNTNRIGSLANNVDNSKTTFKMDKTKNSMTLTVNNIGAKEGVTIVSPLKNNYWVGAKNYDNRYMEIVISFIVILIFAIVSKLRLRSKVRLIKTVEFYPPDDMTPAEMGFLLEGRTEDSHILSSILYLANKGYINIREENYDYNLSEKTEEDYVKDVDYIEVEYQKKSNYDKDLNYGKKTSKAKIPKKNASFVLTKVKDIDEGEKRFIKVLYRALFYKRDSVSMNNLDSKFADKMVVVRDMVSANFVGEKSVYRNISIILGIITALAISVTGLLSILLLSKMIGNTVLMVLGIVISILTLLMFGIVSLNRYKRYLGKFQKTNKVLLFVLGIMIMFTLIILVSLSIVEHKFIIISILYVLSFIASISIMSRTKYNISILGRILGFRDFLEKVEVKKLEMLVEENPQYFYNILPYTYILGLSDVWMKKFDSIDIQSPSWYDGEDTYFFDMFFGMYYMNFMNSNVFSGFLDSDFSGGGFYGGGGNFSGGGFGGGGGGAW